MEKRMTVKEIAKYTGKSTKTVRGWFKSNKLEGTQNSANNEWSATEDAVKKFMGEDVENNKVVVKSKQEILDNDPEVISAEKSKLIAISELERAKAVEAKVNIESKIGNYATVARLMDELEAEKNTYVKLNEETTQLNHQKKIETEALSEKLLRVEPALNKKNERIIQLEKEVSKYKELLKFSEKEALKKQEDADYYANHRDAGIAVIIAVVKFMNQYTDMAYYKSYTDIPLANYLYSQIKRLKNTDDEEAGMYIFKACRNKIIETASYYGNIMNNKRKSGDEEKIYNYLCDISVRIEKVMMIPDGFKSTTN